MKVKIVRNTVAGGVAVNEGQIVDLPEAEAKFLIGIKKAELFVEVAPPENDPGIETTDAVHENVETADVKPAPSKRPGK